MNAIRSEVSQRRVVVVSAHYALSKRRAGFHWIAEALRRAGWHVTFVTVAFSWLSHLKRDHRFDAGAHRAARRVVSIGPGLDSYVWFTWTHPLNRLPGAIASLLTPVFRRYGQLPIPGIEPTIRSANLIVFESTAGLMLVDRFRAWSPSARFVYRVSDDLGLLRAHRVVQDAERTTLSEFSLVSVPSEAVGQRFAGQHPNVRLHHHGIEKSAFDAPSESPYKTSGPNAIFVGISHLDTNFLSIAAEERPDWNFHVVGPFRSLPERQNIVAWGELPFAATVPFIKHADVGLGTRSAVPGAVSLSDSLKIIQYTYARLPIIAPTLMRSGRSNIVTYEPGDRTSIRTALDLAIAMDRGSISRAGILSWDELVAQLAGE
jgi:2-beta-glucuronyltransferase